MPMLGGALGSGVGGLAGATGGGLLGALAGGAMGGGHGAGLGLERWLSSAACWRAQASSRRSCSATTCSGACS